MSSFSPASGPVGTKVTISGSGFVASDIVAFNGTTATVARVNPAGTTLKTSVPALATTGLITVTDPATGQRVDLPNSPFKVTKGIFATPNRVWAGGRFTLEGSGLAPDHSDRVLIGTTTIVQARINANGDFKIGVSVPWDETSRVARLSVDDFAGSVITILYILGSWPMYRHDPQHTGVDTYETSLSVNTVPALKQLWMKLTVPSGTFAMIPSVANGLVYEGADESDYFNLYAFTTDGKKMPWSTGYPYSLLETEPAVTNGNLYYSAAETISPFDASVNAATGTQNWADGLSIISTDTPSAPNVAGGRMFVGAPDGNLYAINASTGVPEWSFQTGGAVHSSPAYDNGIVYVGSDSGYLYAIHAATGVKDWSYGSGGVIDSSAAVVGGIVYVGTENDYAGSVIALNATTGAVVWHDTFKGESFPTSPAVANGVVYIGGSSGVTGYMYALNASTGAQEWHVTSGPTVTDPAYANGVVYYSVDGSSASGKAQVRAIDASNGNVLWHTYSVTDPLAPIISNGIVYVEGENAIFAFSL
jgi:outer membrane protein assembly factor BamB